MKKRIIVFLSIGLIALLCIGGIIQFYTIQSDSGTRYFVTDDTGNKGEFAIYNISQKSYTAEGVSLKGFSADELKKVTTKTYDGDKKKASNLKDAAQIGSSILDRFYEQWTETKTVVVEKNEKANAWIVSGQLWSRKSTSGIGVVVFSMDTGEVFFIGKGEPAS